jgi:Cell division protein CrgA
MAGPAPSSRYTPKAPPEYRVSPTWVPVLMFAFLIVGALVIIVNYTGAAWSTNNWYLIGGLASILAGILVATQWH